MASEWFFESSYDAFVETAMKRWLRAEYAEAPARLHRVTRVTSSFTPNEVQVSPVGSWGLRVGLAFNRWHQPYEPDLIAGLQKLQRQVQPFKLLRPLDI